MKNKNIRELCNYSNLFSFLKFGLNNFLVAKVLFLFHLFKFCMSNLLYICIKIVFKLKILFYFLLFYWRFFFSITVDCTNNKGLGGVLCCQATPKFERGRMLDLPLKPLLLLHFVCGVFLCHSVTLSSCILINSTVELSDIAL